MKLLSMLFLAFSLIAAGGAQFGTFGSNSGALVAASAAVPGQNTASTRMCLNKSGAAFPGAILCQSDKRHSDEASGETPPSWFLLQLRPAVAAIGDGREPSPDLDPPRLAA
ncbi:MAG: hypothetical protein MEQ84_00780 [Mesorhizobium sp.]|nr:hypothetical protein [Mesorhizobium sp.]